MTRSFIRKCVATATLTVGAILTNGVANAEDVTLTMWSHQVNEPNVVAFRELAARNLEQSHPGVHVKITWYDKNPLFTALRTALPAGAGPDVIYLEPDQTQFITNGYIIPLDDLVNWNTIQDWTRKVWTHDGKTYALPQDTYTDEIYYNKDLLKKLGFTLPESGQFTQSQFLEIVKKARAADITPIAQGVGDRPFPGAYILSQALLKKLGPDDYGKLWVGKFSFKDSRVVEVLKWVKELVDAGAYPKNFMTLKLSESHTYFYAKPGALMLPMGSWYTGRAFVPEEQGGQPKDFPLGIMQFPAMDGGACNECKTSGVGSSFAINAASKQRKLAGEFLDAMSTPEMGKRYLETIYYQSAVKMGGTDFSGPYAAYFTELTERQKGAKYFVGEPRNFIQGHCKDGFEQVLNSAFPGGLISVDEATEKMNAACYKG
jgi:multiple sugar transport system substrate-binding protein